MEVRRDLVKPEGVQMCRPKSQGLNVWQRWLCGRRIVETSACGCHMPNNKFVLLLMKLRVDLPIFIAYLGIIHQNGIRPLSFQFFLHISNRSFNYLLINGHQFWWFEKHSLVQRVYQAFKSPIPGLPQRFQDSNTWMCHKSRLLVKWIYSGGSLGFVPAWTENAMIQLSLLRGMI